MAALARPLLYANLAGIWAYIVLWQGAERFYIESFATWVISPIIYTRLCPMPYKEPLLRALTAEPALQDLLCAVPVGLFVVACAFGVLAYRRHSFPFAATACILMSSIFVTYHCVKHMGMTLVLY
jgi:hypothetical protein